MVLWLALLVVGFVGALALAMAAASARAWLRFCSLRSRQQRKKMVLMIPTTQTARKMVTMAPEVVKPS